MAQALFKCPKCRAEMIRDYNGKKKLRTNILVFENGKCLAKCLKCKTDVDVPVSLDLTSRPKPIRKNLRHVIIDVDRR